MSIAETYSMNNQLSLLDLTREEDFLKPIAITNHLFSKVYETGLAGCGLAHISYLGGKQQEHSFQQNGILVHLQPEQNSLRCLGGLLEVENIGIGDTAIIPTSVRHWHRVETEIREQLVVTIESHVIASIAHEVINPERIELRPTFARPDPLIQHIALNLKANLDSKDYDCLYAESSFNFLSTHLLRHYSNNKFQPQNYEGGLSTYKLKLVKNYINDNLDKQIKLNDIATLLNISQFYFCHLFKQSTGIAPYQYVIQQRIEKVKKLIKQNNLPLIEIAYDCGFGSQSQMTQHFRKSVGMTPKVYQKKMEEKKYLK